MLFCFIGQIKFILISCFEIFFGFHSYCQVSLILQRNRVNTSFRSEGQSLVENMVKKEPQSFSHCDSFDHPVLQSIYDCNFENLAKKRTNCKPAEERLRHMLDNGPQQPWRPDPGGGPWTGRYSSARYMFQFPPPKRRVRS